ncbi:hypothetical protein SAMD00023353_2100940 [Rosellinia necatrix]|uniref:Uncharacterized protein n=1 Tax=Rosellinia necatrix TaxID=77044 RepID=A0A1W2TFF2_ROSNE|nr:hypothetical protein SAMD00023353_2100940 [Rosellinia necatrix]
MSEYSSTTGPSGNTTARQEYRISTSPSSSQAPRFPSNERLGISSGAIAGIVIGDMEALAIFSGLVLLVLYYRKRLFDTGRLSGSNTSGDTGIYGSFTKAELDAEGPQVVISRVYELEATREVRELDGRGSPMELDSTPLGP